MELIYRNSFFRDLDNIGSREPSYEIEELIPKISKAHSISAIPGMKQLKRSKAYEYKIELHVQTKIYWILCDVYDNRIEFIRMKSESWCKNNL